MPDQKSHQPSAPNAERGILAAAAIDRDALSLAASSLRPEDFYFPKHAAIFRAQAALFRDGQDVDTVVLLERLRSSGELETSGGSEFVIDALSAEASSASIRQYIRIVREKSLMRRLWSATSQIAEKSCNGVTDPAAFLRDAVVSILSLAKEDDSSPSISLGESTAKIGPEIDGGSGIGSGFRALDDLTGGMKPGEVTILAARTAMGKSALALGAAIYAAKHGAGVLYFSQEMSATQLSLRALSAESGIGALRLRAASVWKSDRLKLEAAKDRLVDLPLSIQERCAIRASEIRTEIVRWRDRRPLRLVVVDYLGLMTGEQSRYRSLYEQMTEISKSVKALATSTKLAFLVLHQLNRAPDGREGGEPRLSDLRDSGQIEQDADTVLLLHRPEIYRPRDLSLKNTALLDVAKNRSGPCGRVGLVFHPETVSFHPLARTSGDERDAEVPF